MVDSSYSAPLVPNKKQKISLAIWWGETLVFHNFGYVAEINYWEEILLNHFNDICLEIKEMQFFITYFIILSFKYSPRDTVVVLVAFFHWFMILIFRFLLRFIIIIYITFFIHYSLLRLGNSCTKNYQSMNVKIRLKSI